MFKTLAATAATLTVITAAATAGTIYPTTCIATDTSNNIVTMSTASGLEYQFEGVEDYEPGDLIGCIMFDNFTPDDVTDDVIIAHRYTGTTKFFDEIISE